MMNFEYPPSLEFIPDLAYGELNQRAHLLDILKPRVLPKEPVPAILFLHGGGWHMYGKYPQINVFLAEAGFVTFSSNYRYSSEAIFPAQLEDVTQTVNWFCGHASQFGADPNRIGVWGISAGGHLAALLGALGKVQAVADVCGPSDFFDPNWRLGNWDLLGGTVAENPELARLASPVHQVGSRSAPFLILHGANDKDVPLSQSERLHQALQQTGVESRLEVFLDGDHFINETHLQVIQQQILEFFRQTLNFQSP